MIVFVGHIPKISKDWVEILRECDAKDDSDEQKCLRFDLHLIYINNYTVSI